MTKKTKEQAAPAKEEQAKPTIQSIIAELVMQPELTYLQISEMVREQIEGANTSTRSVASVASRMRKSGVDVPLRKAAKSAEAK